MLLELSLAASNLGQAAAGNGGPLLSAQTGFLSSDGTHSHVTNRGLGPLPFMDRQSYSGHIPGRTLNPQAFVHVITQNSSDKVHTKHPVSSAYRFAKMSHNQVTRACCIRQSLVSAAGKI